MLAVAAPFRTDLSIRSRTTEDARGGVSFAVMRLSLLVLALMLAGGQCAATATAQAVKPEAVVTRAVRGLVLTPTCWEAGSFRWPAIHVRPNDGLLLSDSPSGAVFGISAVGHPGQWLVSGEAVRDGFAIIDNVDAAARSVMLTLEDLARGQITVRWTYQLLGGGMEQPEFVPPPSWTGLTQICNVE